MAVLTVSAVGAVIGGSIFPGVIGLGITGAGAGWMVGSLIGNALFNKPPTQYNIQPPAPDLGVPMADYGTPLPWVQGTVPVTGVVAWWSDRRKIDTVTETEVGGKGGGQSVVNVTSNYEIDVLFILADGEAVGVSRIWDSGGLIYNNRTDASEETIAASANTSAWRRITFYSGADDQLPDPTYEAAVGVGNAPAYRGVSSVFIEGLQLGQTGQMRFLTFELSTKADSGTIDATVLLQTAFTGNDPADLSVYEMTPALAGGGERIEDNAFVIAGDASGACTLTYTGGEISDHNGEDYTVEFDLTWGGEVSGASDRRLLNIVGTTGDIRLYLVMNTGSLNHGKIYHRDSNAANIMYTSITVPIGGPTRITLVGDDSTNTLRLYFEGVKVLETGTGFSGLPNAAGSVVLGGPRSGATTADIIIDDMRLSLGQRYTGESFTVVRPLPPPDTALTTLTPLTEDIEDVVARLNARAGLADAQYDVTGLSTITREVRGLKVLPGPVRAPLESLASTFFFDMRLADKLSFVPRGGSAVATLAHEDLAADARGETTEPLPLSFGTDLEIAAIPALSYANASKDYEPDTQVSDRLITDVQTTSTVQVPIVLRPDEAKAIVETWALDLKVAATRTKISVLGDYTRLEPGDPVVLTGADGSTYRMRLIKREDSFPVLGFEAVLDDVSILSQQGITSADYTETTEVNPAPDTVAEYLDIPILRDADDAPGFYAAARGEGTPWPGAGIFSSEEDVEYRRDATIEVSGVIGTCTTVLGDWSGPPVFDEMNSVTVSIGDGTLDSTTRAALIASRTLNAMLIGSEIIQFRTATLVTTGVYTLTGLLRGKRGTEWAMVGHGAGERCVLLTGSMLRRIDLANAELGASRYYKAVTLGKRLSAADAETFTCEGIGLKPFSPVHSRTARDGSNNATLSWTRRSRLSCREFSASGTSIPLGEETERYEIDVYADDTFAAVVRTITASSESAEYSAANQTADGLTPGDPIARRVYQLSATVGRGYALEDVS